MLRIDFLMWLGAFDALESAFDMYRTDIDISFEILFLELSLCWTATHVEKAQFRHIPAHAQGQPRELRINKKIWS